MVDSLSVSIAYLLVQYSLRSYCTPVSLAGAGLLAATCIVLCKVLTTQLLTTVAYFATQGARSLTHYDPELEVSAVLVFGSRYRAVGYTDLSWPGGETPSVLLSDQQVHTSIDII